MHWELSDEHEMFATALRDWATSSFPFDVVRELRAEGRTAEFAAELVSAGWWGVGYPESAGGEGGGVLELGLAAREFGRAAAPDSPWLAAALVAALLTDEELARQLSGETRFALAVRADRAPGWAPLMLDGAQVTGEVPHVLGAQDADVLLVPVAGSGGSAEAGAGVARVAVDAVELLPDDLLDASRRTATVRLDGAAAGEVIPADPGVMERVAALAAALVAADSLGAAEKMLELSVEYSLQRHQFGRPIGSFQAVKHACAQMLVTVEAAYSSALYAAAAIDTGLEDAAVIAAVAKAQVGETVASLADSALTVHGAIGYTWEHDLQLLYKRAKLNRTLFGTSAVWNERIASVLLDSAIAS